MNVLICYNTNGLICWRVLEMVASCHLVCGCQPVSELLVVPVMNFANIWSSLGALLDFGGVLFLGLFLTSIGPFLDLGTDWLCDNCRIFGLLVLFMEHTRFSTLLCLFSWFNAVLRRDFLYRRAPMDLRSNVALCCRSTHANYWLGRCTRSLEVLK